MIEVADETLRYREAIAGLPLQARRVEGGGALVIVDGAPGWPQRSLAAVDRGARALVIADPVAADDDAAAALEVVSRGTPVVLDRPRLRADMVMDAAPPAAVRHVTADASAIASEFGRLVGDAIGWLRVLAGGELRLRAAATVPHGLMALFEEMSSGRSAALTASALIGSGGARLRAHAIGEASVEIEVDDATAVRSVEVRTLDGLLRRPRRHEAAGRVALRRAIDAMTDGVVPGDLRGFRHDSALAALAFGADKRD
nr:hypothetical protein [uncultured Microbacterium sp.]